MIEVDYEEVMRSAYQVAVQSPDPSTQTGAVLVTVDGTVAGCNDFPYGVSDEHWIGPKDGKYSRVVHAEMWAIIHAARCGLATEGAVMVAPWAACSNCAKHIAAAGISKLVRHPFLDNGVTAQSHWYDDCLLGDEIMTGAGVEIVEISPVRTSIRLRRDGKIWGGLA